MLHSLILLKLLNGNLYRKNYFNQGNYKHLLLKLFHLI